MTEPVVEKKLSPREAECALWVAQGKTDAEVGTIIGISPRTVRFHIENAKRKFAVATRTQLIVQAIKNGEVTPP